MPVSQQSEKESRGCLEAFLLATSIVGFIVDVFAVLSIIGLFRLSGTAVIHEDASGEVSFGSLSIRLSELTLILLFYVAFAFMVISVVRFLRWDEKSESMPLLPTCLFYGLLLLALLWGGAFVPLEPKTLFRLLGGWLVGVPMLLILYVWRWTDPANPLGIGCCFFVVPVLGVAPLLTLIERTAGTAWPASIGMALLYTVSGEGVLLLAWVILVLPLLMAADLLFKP